MMFPATWPFFAIRGSASACGGVWAGAAEARGRDGDRGPHARTCSRLALSRGRLWAPALEAALARADGRLGFCLSGRPMHLQRGQPPRPPLLAADTSPAPESCHCGAGGDKAFAASRVSEDAGSPPPGLLFLLGPSGGSRGPALKAHLADTGAQTPQGPRDRAKNSCFPVGSHVRHEPPQPGPPTPQGLVPAPVVTGTVPRPLVPKAATAPPVTS